MKKLAYLIACSLVIASFFNSPKAGAVPVCSTKPSFNYNLLETIKNNATTNGLSFDDNTMPYAVYYIDDGASGALRVSYGPTANTTWIVTGSDTSIQIDPGGNVVFRSTDSTVAGPGSFVQYPQWVPLNGYCLLYGNRLNYSSYSGTVVGRIPAYTTGGETGSGSTTGGGMTATEAEALADKYIAPIYRVIGATAALAVLYAAYAFVLKPFTRRFR